LSVDIQESKNEFLVIQQLTSSPEFKAVIKVGMKSDLKKKKKTFYM